MEATTEVSRTGTLVPIDPMPEPKTGSVHHPRHGEDGKGKVSLRPIQTRDGFQAHKTLKQLKDGHHAAAPVKLKSAFAKAAVPPTSGAKGPVKLESGSASKLALKSAEALKLN